MDSFGEHYMNSEEALTQQMLSVMKKKPFEKSARGISDLLGDTKLYYKVRERLNTLVELDMVRTTRRVGKTDFYCLPEQYVEVMGD